MLKCFYAIMGLFMVILFTGCSASAQKVILPTSEQIESADYGEYPTNYEELVKKHITNLLIDPTSPIFSDWKEPKKGWYQERYGQKKLYYGYKVCFFVNSKNRMGGYAGKSQYLVIINNNQIVFDSIKGLLYSREVKEECSF